MGEDLEPAAGPGDDADDHGSLARPDEVVVPIDALGALIEEASRLRLPKVTMRLRRAFYVDEALIRRLDTLVTTRFGMIDSITSVDCRCDVRYADVSGESYRSLDECLGDAGTSADPERLEIHWSALTKQGLYYAVDCCFTTEQPLASDPEAGPSPESAQMSIGAISANKQWARDVVRDARTLLDANSKIPSHFRPLQLFGSALYRGIMAYLLGALVWFGSLGILSRLVQSESRAERLEAILSERSLDGRIEALVRDLLRPETSFSLGLILFGLPLVLFFIAHLIADRNLSRLYPRSSIGTGLAQKRAQDRDNTRSLVLFGVVVALAIAVLANVIFRFV